MLQNVPPEICIKRKSTVCVCVLEHKVVILYQTYLVKGGFRQRMFTVAWLVAGFTAHLRKDKFHCGGKIELSMATCVVENNMSA